MTRGNGNTTKVHFKGKNDDFVVIVESAQAVRDWKADKSVPLAQVVDGFKIFVTHKHGAQGVLDAASNSQLEFEFGSSKDDDAIAQILEKGDIQQSDTHGRSGERNVTQGGSVSHN